MVMMFYCSKFTGDISNWNTSSLVFEGGAFKGSNAAKKLGTENPSFEQVKSHFLNLKLEQNLQKSSPGQNQASKVRL